MNCASVPFKFPECICYTLLLTLYSLFVSRFSCLHHSQGWVKVSCHGIRRRAVPQWPDREKKRGRPQSVPCCKHRESRSACCSWPAGTSFTLCSHRCKFIVSGQDSFTATRNWIRYLLFSLSFRYFTYCLEFLPLLLIIIIPSV